MATCKSCGCNIEWHKSPLGRWVPYDLNGACHFETCPHADKWRGRSKVEVGVNFTRLGVHPEQKQLTEWSPLRNHFEDE